jgi:hypothetical protein
MALPAQGGLNQVSAQPKPVAPAGGNPASGKLDVDAKQAELLESQSTQTGLKDKAVDDLDAQREAMNLALLRMRASLDSRKNRMFDPVLMQTAAGFLKPTKTGSFGESLGYAAEGAGVASERDQVRQAENLKLEQELTEKEMAFRRQLMGDKFMQRFSPREGAPTSTSQAAAQVSAAPVLGEGKQVAPVAPLSPSQRILQGNQQEPQVTQNDINEAIARGLDKDLITRLENRLKFQQQEKELALKAQTNEQAARAERVKFTPQGAPDNFTVEVPRDLYDKYLEALRTRNKTKDNQTYFEFLRDNNLLTQTQLPKEPTEPIKNAPSATETEVEKASKIKRSEEAIKADQVLQTQISTSAGTAQERVIAADQIYGLANSKETGRVFEFFTQPTIRNIIATAIEGKGGVRTPLGSLEIANIKKAMQLAGATPKELDAAQTMLRSTTMLNMQDTISLMNKQGAITEGERALISQLNPNVFEDTRNSAMAKSQLVKARAEYDKDVADIYDKWVKKNPNGFVTEFRQSPQYLNRYNDYNKYTDNLAQKYFPGIVPAPSTRRKSGPLESQIQ